MQEPSTSESTTSTGAPARRGSALVWIGLLLIVAVALAVWWGTHGSSADRAAADAESQHFGARLDALEHTLGQLRGNADTLRSRLDDGDKVDQSVREQLLSVGERTRLLEDTVANLADKRLSGHDTLALDEAELLLTLAGERYALFHDSAAAIAAYGLADTALSEVQDAAFSTVRQSIKSEIAALSAQSDTDPAALAAQLSQLEAQLAQQPAAGRISEPSASAQQSSRLERIFGAFIQVHHEGDAAAAAGATDAVLARELSDLDLRQAQAAALARDEARYRLALNAARRHAGAAFAPGAELDAALAQIDALAKTELVAAVPSSMGSALKELRSLRASHALRAATERSATASGEVK